MGFGFFLLVIKQTVGFACESYGKFMTKIFCRN